jgi:hypothetical protein
MPICLSADASARAVLIFVHYVVDLGFRGCLLGPDAISFFHMQLTFRLVIFARFSFLYCSAL